MKLSFDICDRGEIKEGKGIIRKSLHYSTVSCNVEMLCIPGHRSSKLTSAVDFSRVTGVSYFLNGKKEAGNYVPNTRLCVCVVLEESGR